MNKKYILIIILIIVSFFIGTTQGPEKIIEKEKIVYTEKEQTKKDLNIEKIEIIKKDGTIFRKEKVIDKSQITKEKQIVKEKEKIIDNKSKWLFSVYTYKNYDNLFDNNNKIGIIVQRRVFGNFFLGGGTNSDKQIVLILSGEF